MLEKVVIVGTGETGCMLHDYLKFDSDYEVIAFASENEYIHSEMLMNLPVVPLENLQDIFNPKEVRIMVAVSYVEMNNTRSRLLKICRDMGFRFASYVSSRCSVWKDVQIGENVIVMEGATIQYGATIEDNVIMWPNASVGHHCKIHKDVWISAGCMIGGFAEVFERSFLGMNVAIKGGCQVKESSLVGAGVYISTDTSPYSIYGNTSYENALEKVKDMERRRLLQLTLMKN